ncbi:ferritin-like domain-containing protein [Erythrobacter sp. SCSIO 43205]|uniref:DUF892 family protein n=1 Tax=Erythrobacter sp. SCSIO 43205 TaxID=2779361 RepID=UPI001CAA0443|nr:DUF892 family protein [Erythrobacter sp. SCSIO 43205]UAB78912.1 ferritin-like domain-containing protein [Erythrobacter sp. SCSIO 43205]
MAIATLKDVYIDQLQDLYSACSQSKSMTEKLAGAATNADLKDALKAGANGIVSGMGVATDLVRSHDADPTDEFCKGMEGLVKEAQAHALDAQFEENDARDAMIITQYQRMTHYAIAGWGCLVAFASRLGLDEEAKRLQECLDETYEGDLRMTQIAKGAVNQAAAA